MALDHVVVMILPNPRLEIRCNSCRMWVVYNPVWTLGHKAGLPTSWFVRGSSVRPRRVPRRRRRSRKLNTLEWLSFQLLSLPVLYSSLSFTACYYRQDSYSPSP